MPGRLFIFCFINCRQVPKNEIQVMNINRLNPKIAALLRGNFKVDPLPGKEKPLTRKNPSLG
jgi:hypothetical protein